MDKDSKSGSAGLPGNGIVAVVLLVMGALFVHESPLTNTRSALNAQPLDLHHAKLKVEQDGEARPWQDPLGEAARYRAVLAKAGEAKLAKEDERHGLDLLVRRVHGVGQPSEETAHAHVLLVLLTAGHYSENVESRRRHAGQHKLVDYLAQAKL